LDALVARDPRYEWRERAGTISVRPVKAWTDPKDPLARVIPAVRLDNVTTSDAIATFTRLLTGTARYCGIPDTKTFSLNLPRGTAFAFLDAIVRVHGELFWSLEELPERDQKRGARHQLNFWMAFGGQSYPVLIP
jgi:hypothetical protein